MLDGDRFYKHSYAQELLAKGEVAGEAKSILVVLAARGMEVPERAQRKILACKDQAQLEHWLRQAAVSDDLERLFSE
jgi:hypothetical protein